MTAFLSSLVFVVLAEMGDKTQLLAMAFATRYRWQTVMWGVFAATVFNHLLAVVVGNYITQIIPLNYVQIAAAVSFIILVCGRFAVMNSMAKIKRLDVGLE